MDTLLKRTAILINELLKAYNSKTISFDEFRMYSLNAQKCLKENLKYASDMDSIVKLLFKCNVIFFENR